MHHKGWQTAQWVEAASVPSRTLEKWVQEGHVKSKQEENEELYNEQDVLRCRVQFNVHQYKTNDTHCVSYKFE